MVPTVLRSVSRVQRVALDPMAPVLLLTGLAVVGVVWPATMLSWGALGALAGYSLSGSV
jgi:hypothetical protein